jgi:hypothetical protein
LSTLSRFERFEGLPKMLRPYFRFLGKLSQSAYQSLKEFFQKTLNGKEAVPGVVVSIQTFGDLVNFHPHLHCLVTDGCFMANDWFYVLPEIDIKKLESLFRHKVLKLLLSEKRISEELVEKLLSWKNSGFSVHNSGQNQKPGPPGAGKPGPIYSAFPIFFGENHLPAADENGSLSL